MSNVRAGDPFIAVRCEMGEHKRCVQPECECPHHTVTADVRRDLAKALAAEDGERSGPGVDWDAYAAALLPTVQRLIADAEKRAAAAAVERVRNTLRGLADEWRRRGAVRDFGLSLTEAGNRIDAELTAALDPAGAASGETT